MGYELKLSKSKDPSGFIGDGVMSCVDSAKKIESDIYKKHATEPKRK